MEEQNLTWPDHYPENCPPAYAEGFSGVVYRFTNGVNPKPKDFLSYYELRSGKNWEDKACQARGLSVYTTEEDCITAIAMIPALRKKKLCAAELSAEAGVIAPTPSNNNANHKTLWSLFGAEKLSEIFMPLETMKVAHA